MELRQLVTFKTIVEADGFKRAADQLGYAQSSITAHVKELEQELGQPLFHRLGKKVSLTQAGRSFLPYAEQILQLYIESKDVLRNTDEPSGPLAIGASESLLIYCLPDWLKRFVDTYPKVELHIRSVPYPDVAAPFKRGEMDLALLVEQADWAPSELTVHQIRRDSLVLVRKADASPHRSTMLYPEHSCSWRSMLDEYVLSQGTDSISKVALPSVEAIKQSVRCGLGMSILPRFTVEGELNSGELEVVDANLPDAPIAVYAVYHKNMWRSPSVEAFVQILLSASK